MKLIGNMTSLYENLRAKAPKVLVKNNNGAYPRPEYSPNPEARSYLEAIDVVLSGLPECDSMEDLGRFSFEYTEEIEKMKLDFDQKEASCKQQRLDRSKIGVLSYLNQQSFAVPKDELWLKGGIDCGVLDEALSELVASGDVMEETEISGEKEYEGHEYKTYHTLKSKWDSIKRLFIAHSNAL